MPSRRTLIRSISFFSSSLPISAATASQVIYQIYAYYLLLRSSYLLLHAPLAPSQAKLPCISTFILHVVARRILEAKQQAKRATRFSSFYFWIAFGRRHKLSPVHTIRRYTEHRTALSQEIQTKTNRALAEAFVVPPRAVPFTSLDPLLEEAAAVKATASTALRAQKKWEEEVTITTAVTSCSKCTIVSPVCPIT